jgi:hypothetical protein
MAKSIIQRDKQCYICGTTNNLECHHIFFGNPNRRLSEQYGLKVYLCHRHHNEPPTGVHYNTEIRQMLQAKAQKIAMRRYKWTIEDFIKIFGKNYILD